MATKNEKMDLIGNEDAEKEYLRTVTHLDGSLDHSIDSLQGSLTLPTFTMGQSSELAGSQGFQILGNRNLSLSQKSNDLNSQNLLQAAGGSQIGGSESGFIFKQDHVTNDLSRMTQTSDHVNTGVSHVTPNIGHVTSGISHVTTGVNLHGNTLIFQGSQLSALNVVQNSNQYQIVIPSVTKDMNIGQNLTGTVTNSEVSGTGSVGEVNEGSNHDDKPGRCKTSPKHRGRKSRSTSSTGNEMTIKTEAAPGPSPCRMETSDTQQPGGDMGFKPSLLDEILTEKKLALMRSPEVIRFLQAQQQQQNREKCAENIQSKNS